LSGEEVARFRPRFQRLDNHRPRTRTNVPTIEMTHAKTIFTRFEDDLRDGGSGVDPSSGDRVAVGMESVFVLLSAPVLVELKVIRQWPNGAWDLRDGSHTRPLTCP
jgi:hypothetical protein